MYRGCSNSAYLKLRLVRFLEVFDIFTLIGSKDDIILRNLYLGYAESRRGIYTYEASRRRVFLSH